MPRAHPTRPRPSTLRPPSSTLRRRASSTRSLAALAVLAGASARADELPSPSNLDGWYLTIGPVAAAAHVHGRWISAIGGEASLVRLDEHRLPAVLGVAGGGVSYSSLPGGRFWLEAEIGIEDPLPFALGIAVGATAEVNHVDPPRFGVEATLWAVGGFVPYVRVGTLEIVGSFVEMGVMLKVPVRFAY